MPLVINTNVASLSAQRYLAKSAATLGRSMEKLASGHRINRAADDAAGLQLSEYFRAQIRGSKKALENTQDAINLLQIADGAMSQIHDHLHRVRELMIQAMNDTYNTQQRNAIKAEIVQHLHGIDQIAESTSYNGIHILDESISLLFPAPQGFRIQVSPNAEAPATPLAQWKHSIRLGVPPLGDMDANNLGMVSWTYENTSSENIPFATGPDRAVLFQQVENSMRVLSGNRGRLGALINRMESVASNLQISIENISAAESRIRDTDIAAESARLVKSQILRQASAAMLTQANQAPSLALQLLQKGR